MSLTSKDIQVLSQLLDEKLIPLENRMESVENRLESVENRLESVENRLESVENRLESVENGVQSLERRVTRIEVDLLENNVIPRLNEIEACYSSTYERYRDSADRIEAALEDVELLKHTVSEHSDILKKIS